MRIKILPLLLFWLLFSVLAKAQSPENTVDKYISLYPQVFQIKDNFNYGLTHSGLNLVLGYSLKMTTNTRIFSYFPSVAFGVNYNKGIGLAWQFKPLDFSYLFKIHQKQSKHFALGPYLSTNYHWQRYPELQGGHLFWFTSIEIGPKVELQFPFKNRLLKIVFGNSIAGLTSRPLPATETYFYSIKISDYITEAHSNLELGTTNLFNHTSISTEILEPIVKRLSMGYAADYFGYFEDPKFGLLTHSFNLKWKIGKI